MIMRVILIKIKRSRHRDINSIEEPLFDKDKTSILNRNKLLIKRIHIYLP